MFAAVRQVSSAWQIWRCMVRSNCPDPSSFILDNTLILDFYLQLPDMGARQRIFLFFFACRWRIKENGWRIRTKESYKFWNGYRQAQTHSEDQLPDYGMNPKLHARSQRHWTQTHNRSPLLAQRTESGNPPLQSQRVSVNKCHLALLIAGCNLTSKIEIFAPISFYLRFRSSKWL